MCVIKFVYPYKTVHKTFKMVEGQRHNGLAEMTYWFEVCST